MKRLTTVVLVAVAGIGLVLTAGFLIPRAVRAGSPVAVNPTALRTPWQGSCDPAATSSSSEIATCTITATPASQELVLTAVAYIGYTTDASTPEYIYLSATTAGHAAVIPWVATGTSSGILVDGDYRVHVSNAVEIYVDPGTTITCGVNVPAHADFNHQVCNLYGYYTE
jgi:hypothetical protein